MDREPLVAGVARRVGQARAAGRRVALVPTMGNLHAGHLELVRVARELAEFTVVSVFVNPLQFGPNEDFTSYPRTLERDGQMLQALGTDLLFCPSVAEFYPRGPHHSTQVEVPDLGAELCGRSRPTHFRGVTTVVAMLFNAVRPDLAVFGAKDYQQLTLIRRMVEDLHMAIEIRAVATVREDDGLAMSSRNAYLTTEERVRAPALYQALCAAREALRAGQRDLPMLERKGMQALEQAGFRPDYFAVRRADDLAEPRGSGDVPLVVLAAGWLGRARLIDNVGVD